MGRDILYISYRGNVSWCTDSMSNLGALPETTGNFATMYNWNENMQFHANVFANFLKGAIDNYKSEDMLRKLAFAKNWADNFYNWDIRSQEWIGMLNGLLELEKAKKPLQ